jgi:hypothetical protein
VDDHGGSWWTTLLLTQEACQGDAGFAEEITCEYALKSDYRLAVVQPPYSAPKMGKISRFLPFVHRVGTKVDVMCLL